MAVKRSVLFFLMLIFLVSSVASIFFLLKTDFYFNSNLFWTGAVAGFLCPPLLASVGLVLFSVLLKNVPAKRLGFIISVIAVLGVVVILICEGFGSSDSDVWWYGAIAGFLGSLSLTFFILTVFMGYKLTKSS
jgi:hypothetical protein